MTTEPAPPTAPAPRFSGGGEISFAERPVPRPGPGQLLLAVGANAICGTDRKQYLEGSEVTPGHEAAGVVAAAGEGASIAEGTAGVVYLMDYCGSCRSCRGGFTNQCLAKRADMGFTHDGGYGPYELVHETNFFPIASAIPLWQAPLLLDVMGTSGHAIGRALLVRPEIESVLITGAGPVGLGLLAAARLTFSEGTRILVTDVTPYRLALVERLGGIPIDASKQRIAEALRRNDLDEVDACFDSTGRGAVRQEALDCLGRRGVLVCVGHGEQLVLDVSMDLIAPERAVLGSEYFRFDELPANLELLHAQRDYLGQIITHRFPVSQIDQAFRVFFSGESGKVIVEQ